MNPEPTERLRKLLAEAAPAMGEAELSRDLWPEMLERLQRRPATWGALDYALAVGAALCCLLYPEALLALVYHL